MMIYKLVSVARTGAARNAVSLGLIQSINLLTPLVVLPYVLRVLDPSQFGKVIIYQALAQYFSIFIDFGFQLSATKKVAIIRDDHRRLAEYFAVVQTCRLGLALLSVMVAMIIFWVAPGVRDDGDIYFACLLAMLGTLLTPMWLFAGLERIAAAAFAVVAAKVCAIPLTFLLVRGPGDAWVFAGINSMSMVLGGALCILLIVRWRLVKGWVPPSVGHVVAALKDGWHYFVTVAAATFYSTTNPIMLGLVTSSAQVGYFGAADRIRLMSLAPLQPISNAYYPVLSRLFANDVPAAFTLLRRLFWVLFAGMALVTLALFAGAPLIVDLLMGKQYGEAVSVLRIMAAVPLLIGINTALGPLAVLAMGMKREGSRIILVCGAINLVLLSILGSHCGADGAALSLLVTEGLVAVCLAVTVRRRAKAIVSATA